MTSNPYNLVLRLLIEFYGYIVFGFAGFFLTSGMIRWPLAILLPIAAGFFWGTFYVDKDPAGIGKAIVRVSGIQRLIIEILFYAFTVTLSFIFVSKLVSFIYLYLIIIHNAFSFNRINWLIKKDKNNRMEESLVNK
jgi:hypothetical protein